MLLGIRKWWVRPIINIHQTTQSLMITQAMEMLVKTRKRVMITFGTSTGVFREQCIRLNFKLHHPCGTKSAFNRLRETSF